MISLAMLSGCTAASHPSVLAAAAPDSAVAAAVSAPNSPSASVAASPQPSALPGAAATSSASIAGTPTSAADASPTALSSNDIATGVRATAQTFFDDLNIAFTTGDVTKITALTAPTCGCRSLVKLITATYAQHQRIVGVVASLTSIQVVSFVPAGATADVHYSISAGRILDVSGNQVNTSVNNPDEHSAMFVLGAGSQWIVEQNTLLNASTK
jgi:hypothetical protein